MLKIKDDIDLKKMKKFGFNLDDDVGRYKLIERNIIGISLYINMWNRKILFKKDYVMDSKCLETLYDLITAGFVEKI